MLGSETVADIVAVEFTAGTDGLTPRPETAGFVLSMLNERECADSVLPALSDAAYLKVVAPSELIVIGTV